MSTPCALITSCSAVKASELVKKILSIDDLPPATTLLENICAYPWHVETKYYTADVSLCTSDVRTIGDVSFADRVQAFVAVFDTTQKSSFDQVCLWLPYLRELNPPVRILVCNQCLDDDVVSRDVAIGWCLDNGFELVELEPVIGDDEDGEDDFKETVGIQRVVEALSCHSWPNLVMKDKPTFGLAYLEQLRSEVLLPQSNGDEISTNAHTEVDDSDDGWSQFVTSESSNSAHFVSSTQQQSTNGSETTTVEPNHSSSPQNVNGEKSTEDLIDSIIGDDTTDVTGDSAMGQESFEKLFDQLRVMKAAAVGMNTDQRKKYAEQVTMQFWQALGGNVDEFEGLSSDSD